jgi:hypothetical protein
LGNILESHPNHSRALESVLNDLEGKEPLYLFLKYFNYKTVAYFKWHRYVYNTGETSPHKLLIPPL